MTSILRSLLLGSDQQEFQQLDQYPAPFEACPDSPNCIIHSNHFRVNADELFDRCLSALGRMSPEQMKTNPDNHRADAVFKIPLFGFRDDFLVCIESADDHSSVLHLKSASRAGHGDLGVNARRVQQFLHYLL